MMDEINNQIEDVQYIGAVADDKPKPIREITWPTDEEVETWKTEKAKKRQYLINICASPMGFFLVSLLFHY